MTGSLLVGHAALLLVFRPVVDSLFLPLCSHPLSTSVFSRNPTQNVRDEGGPPEAQVSPAPALGTRVHLWLLLEALTPQVCTGELRERPLDAANIISMHVVGEGPGAIP